MVYMVIACTSFSFMHPENSFIIFKLPTCRTFLAKNSFCNCAPSLTMQATPTAVALF